jgi:putative tricarboxylic transport membrane protein
MEKSFRQTLIAEQGNVLAFIERPLSATFIFLSVLFFIWPIVGLLRGSKQEHPHFSSKRPDFSKQNS